MNGAGTIHGPCYLTIHCGSTAVPWSAQKTASRTRSRANTAPGYRPACSGEWIGSSYKDLIAFPADVQRSFGYALSLAQAGDKADATKVLRGFGGTGVLEVVENNVGGTYRAVYTVKFEEAVFVLPCFQKKSRREIATPKADMDIIRARLKIAELTAKELRNEKANG